MKKTYLQPTMPVVTLQQQGIICTSPGGSSVTLVGGGVFDVIESDENYYDGAR